MKKDIWYSRFFIIFLSVIDITILFITYNIFFEAFQHFSSDKATGTESEQIPVLCTMWLIAALFMNLYSIDRVSRFEEIRERYLYALGLQILLVSAYFYSQKLDEFSRIASIGGSGLSWIFIFMFRYMFYLILKYYRKSGFNTRNVVIVGTSHSALELCKFFRSKSYLGYLFLGFFDDKVHQDFSINLVKGDINQMKIFCLENGVDEIYYAEALTDSEVINELTEFADNNFIYFKLVPDFRGLEQRKFNMDLYGNIPIITIRREPLSLFFNRIIKRLFDIVFSFLVICLLFPVLFPILAIVIKLESKGPVFFKQLRSGRRNSLFEVYKFRTMTVNTDSDSKQASRNDARITRVGSFLRRSSLDELPQFFNVLLGQMSVVGPRPHMLKHTEEYSKIIDRYMIRHFILPGITGNAQVNGYRGETTEPGMMEKRVEYDSAYIENWSLWFDIKIIFKTVTNIFQGEDNAF